MFSSGLFNSYFLGGFECATHRRFDGERLDIVAATKHDQVVAQDYRQLAQHGIRAVRDGLRWHLIETSPGHYDWSSFLPMLRAAERAGVQVIWDLCHYGWPDGLDIWTPAFIDRFSSFAAAVTRLVREESNERPFFCPVNEISFWSWAGGEVGRINPFNQERGLALKEQLVRASIAAIEAVWSVDARARIVHTDPVVNVVAGSGCPQEQAQAEAYRCAQFQVWDMLSGRLSPHLGGQAKYLDIIGVNYYWNNQWVHGASVTGEGMTIGFGHPGYRSFKDILTDTYERYRRPMFVSETGIEGRGRSSWLRYVSAEVHAAVCAGVPVEGICIYPILDYPGWDDERSCECGLLGAVDGQGQRPVYQPLASELRRQQAIFAHLFYEQAGGGRRAAGRAG